MAEAEEEKTKSVIAKVIETCIEVYKFTVKYWYILTFFSAILWKVAGFYYTYKVEPQVQTYVRTIVYEMGKDSIPIMIHMELDTILAKRGVGFRTGIAISTKVEKDSVIAEYKKMYDAYLKVPNQIDSLKKFVKYSNGVDYMLVKELFTKIIADNGAIIYEGPSGDDYYFDIFGMVWDATLKSDGWSYYPPYNNNKKTKCI